MSYLSEFPDYDGDFYCPKGFSDNSWHNDTCPHALRRIETETRTIEFSVWQDYVDVDKREYDNAKRYAFQIHIDDELIYSYETDELQKINDLIEGVQI